MTTEPNDSAQQPDLTKMVEAAAQDIADIDMICIGGDYSDPTAKAVQPSQISAILLRHLQPLAEQVDSLQARAEAAETSLKTRDAEYMRGAQMLVESATTWQERAEAAEKQLTAAQEELASCRAVLGHYFDYFHGNSGGMPEGTSERARKLLNRIHFNK